MNDQGLAAQLWSKADDLSPDPGLRNVVLLTRALALATERLSDTGVNFTEATRDALGRSSSGKREAKERLLTAHAASFLDAFGFLTVADMLFGELARLATSGLPLSREKHPVSPWVNDQLGRPNSELRDAILRLEFTVREPRARLMAHLLAGHQLGGAWRDGKPFELRAYDVGESEMLHEVSIIADKLDPPVQPAASSGRDPWPYVAAVLLRAHELDLESRKALKQLLARFGMSMPPTEAIVRDLLVLLRPEFVTPPS